MHETFQILEPHLAEHGMSMYPGYVETNIINHLKSRTTDFKLIHTAMVRRSESSLCKLHSVGAQLRLTDQTIEGPANSKFDLHHPDSIRRLVAFLKGWFSVAEMAIKGAPEHRAADEWAKYIAETYLPEME